jgi:probable selenium-dependent hydroxylase accessory protein YqeC
MRESSMAPVTAEALLDALHAHHGIIAAVGAGGKKSTLYRLLEAHRLIGTGRVALTTTVQIAPPPRNLDAAIAIGEDTDIADALEAHPEGPMFLAAPSAKPGRFAGLPPALVRTLHEDGRFKATLVKADGARMRLLKAPAADEPVLPPDPTTVLHLVSAGIFGRLLLPDVVHRPERVAVVVGAKAGERLTPVHVARLLASDQGALQGVGRAVVVPVINMVDDQERLTLAREAAAGALARSDRFDRVVLARMADEQPLVEIVARH